MARESDKAAKKSRPPPKFWPTNPKLTELFGPDLQSGGLVALNDFDRLLSESNDREIARRQYEIARLSTMRPARKRSNKS